MASFVFWAEWVLYRVWETCFSQHLH